VEISGRIFVESGTGKNRLEIKAILDREGRMKTLEGEAADVHDTVSDAAQPYDHTPSTLRSQHADDTSRLPQQYGDLIEEYNNSLARAAIASLQLHRTLLEEKDVQLRELEVLIKRLRTEKQALEEEYKTELVKVLDNVVQWKAKHSEKVS
jgi:hypothetical protein